MRAKRDKRANRDEFLGRLFATYRELLGEFEPSPAFSAKVWAAIEARRRLVADRRQEMDFWTACLTALSPRLAFAALAFAALLAATQWLALGDARSAAVLEASYVDVLVQNAIGEPDEAVWVVAENGE